MISWGMYGIRWFTVEVETETELNTMQPTFLSIPFTELKMTMRHATIVHSLIHHDHSESTPFIIPNPTLPNHKGIDEFLVFWKKSIARNLSILIQSYRFLFERLTDTIYGLERVWNINPKRSLCNHVFDRKWMLSVATIDSQSDLGFLNMAQFIYPAALTWTIKSISLIQS